MIKFVGFWIHLSSVFHQGQSGEPDVLRGQHTHIVFVPRRHAASRWKRHQLQREQLLPQEGRDAYR